MSTHLIETRDGYYWRPDSRGYTGTLWEAGLYTQSEAERTEKSTHGEHRAVALKDVINRDVDHSRKRLHQAQAMCDAVAAVLFQGDEA